MSVDGSGGDNRMAGGGGDRLRGGGDARGEGVPPVEMHMKS